MKTLARSFACSAVAVFAATLTACTCAGPADTTPPTFAGVTGVAVVDDNTLRLSWDAASDDTTPAEALTYLVFQGAAADAIDTATPVLTTAPGALTADVGGLLPATTYFFIVRAQDAAGNVDANEVVASGATTFGGRPPGRQLGSFTLQGSIRRAVTAGNRMYLGLAAEGIEIDDITDPPRPIRLSGLAVAESAEDVAVEPVRQLLYVADGTRGLTIVDVRDSAAPVLLSTFDPGLAGQPALAVAANEEHAYLSTAGAIFVVDVSAPTAPELVARLSTASDAVQMAAEDDRLFTLHAGGAVSLWDVSEPGPRLEGTFAGPADTEALAVGRDTAYLASPSQGVKIVSFADPAAPAVLGTVGSSAAAVGVEGATVALAGPSAFFTYDISDPGNPQLLTGNPVVTTPDVVAVSRGLGIYIYRALQRATPTSQGVILNIPPYAWLAVPGSRTDAPANTGVYFEFSKPMDPASLTAGSLTVTDASGNAVPGSAAFEWSNTRLRFTPSAALSPSTTYTVRLSAELQDTRGDGLWPATGVTYSFTTIAPTPPPPAPAWLSAIPGDGYVRLSWPYVSGAARYALYWSTSPGVTTASNRLVRYGTQYSHWGLANGQPVYYRVAAENAFGEGPLSAEVSATPIPPPPPQPPSWAWASGANARVTVSWTSVSGAYRYNVYWSTAPNQPLAARTRVASVGRPFVHQGLTNGTPYYYVVTAENSGGESAPSPEVTATPNAPPVPAQVTGLWAQAGDARVTLQWSRAAGASWYDVYAATSPGTARTLPRVGRAWGTSFTHWGLTNGQPYFYVVVAGNDGGDGPASVEVSALPQPPPIPDAPLNVGTSSGDRRATVYWSSSAGATRYNLYWSTSPGVTRANGLKVSGVRSPFTHWGLTNGQPYYYVVTAQNSGGESVESAEVVATPQAPPIPLAPQNVTATASDAAVQLRWQTVPGATSYTIYFSTAPGVSRATASRLYAGVYGSYWHRGLANGTTYYYVVTASNSGGESVESAEVSATPALPPAPTLAPQGVTGSPGDARDYVWWSYVSGAAWYNVYWSTSPGVTTASTRVSRVWPTWVHWAITNGTTYYYRVSAENTGGEGPLSAEIALTPQAPPPPGVPTGLTARAGDRRVDLSWNYVSGATNYDIYWSTQPGVTLASPRISVWYARSYAHLARTNGQQYCYAIAARNSGGQSALSAEVCATPQPPPAPSEAPTLTVTALDASTRLAWSQVQGATLYYVYFKQGPGVTPQNGTRLGVGYWGPYTHAGLSNGVQYCYVATAVNSGGEGPASGEVCATPTLPPPPGTPTQFSATPLNASVRVSFQGVAGAYRYNLYWSTTSGVTPQTGTRITGVYSGYVHAGLTNGTAYYYVLTAESAGGESAPTAQASATPVAPSAPAAPTGVSATPGNTQNTVSWGQVSGATSFNVYWSTQAGVTKQTGTRVTGATSPWLHTQLTNGVAYYYVVTAVGPGGESADSAQVSATPAGVQPPAAPASLSAVAGDGQVTLDWPGSTGATSYNLYWSTTTGVTRANGTKISGVSPGYVHTGRTNGTTYYYVVTAQSAAGESTESPQASATPTGASIAAPTWISVTPGNAQVTLAWNPVSGATSYRLYWSTSSTVSKTNGTLISSVTSPYSHTGRTNGTTYYYVVTAVGPSGESAESVVRSATPGALTAPTLAVTAGYRSVGATVGTVTGARYYNLYWRTTSGVTPQNGTRITSTSRTITHLGAETGTTYYYVATAVTDSGETPASIQRSAAPVGPPAPTVSVTPRDGQNLVNVGSQGMAMARTLYWSTTTPINKGTAGTLPITGSTVTHLGLTNGTTYYYLIEAVFPEGIVDSTTVSGAPRPATLTAPSLPVPVAGYRKVTLGWSYHAEATSYRVYWSTSSPVTTSSSVVTVTGTVDYVHTGLTTGTPYYYAVSAVYPGGESALSTERSATPGLPAPGGLNAQQSDQALQLNWSTAEGATGYNLYWSTTTGVTKANGTQIAGASRPYLHTGLTNATNYYYVVTAVYPDGESADSAQVTAQPAALAPTSLSAQGGAGQTRVSWAGRPNATSYNLYWSTTPGVTKANGTKIAGATSPYVHSGLTDGTTYYYVVTAQYGATESPDSTQASAQVRLNPPSSAGASGELNQNRVYWNSSLGATGFNIYWSNSPDVSPSNGTQIAISGGSTYGYTHGGLTNGTAYYYVVTAVAGAAESAPTAVAVGLPGFPASPGVTATGGDQTVQLSTGRSGPWAMYWSTSPTVSTTTGTRVLVQGPAWNHSGLTNGTPYYYVVTQVGATGDEGPPSYVSTATPGQRVPSLAVGRVDATSVQLGIGSVPGVTSWNIYWGTSPGVTRLTGTPILDVFNPIAFSTVQAMSFPWDHVGLTPGTTYYWVVTAVGPSGESVESVEVSAQPRAGPANAAATTNAGTGEVTLTWDAAAGATSYRVYCSTAPNARSSGSLCATVAASPATYTLSTWSDRRYFQVTAVGATGESGPSTELVGRYFSSTPAAPTLAAPGAGDGFTVLRWPTWVGESNGDRPTSWDLYYRASPGVTKANGTRIAGVTPTYVHTGLSNGTTYYYVLVAANPLGEGPLSNEVSATPVAASTGQWTSVGGPATSGLELASSALAVRGTTPYVVSGGKDARGRVRVRAHSFDGSTWSGLGGVLSADPDSTAGMLRAAQDASYVYAAWSETTGPSRRLEIVAQRHDGSGWARMGSSFTARNGLLHDLLLIGGTPHLLSAEQNAAGQLVAVVRSWSGSAWSPVGSALTTAGQSISAGRLLAYVAEPVAAFLESPAPGAPATPRVLHYVGGSWTPLALTPPSGMVVDEVAAANSASELYVALAGTLAGVKQVVVYRSTGGAFTQLGGVLNGGSGAASQISAAVAGGVIHVSMTETDAFGLLNHAVKRWSGTNWQQVGAGVRYSGGSIVTAPSNLVSASNAPWVFFGEGESLGNGPNDTIAGFVRRYVP